MRFVLLVVALGPAFSCVTASTLRGPALRSLEPGLRDAVVLEPPGPPAEDERAIRLEPSSLVRFSTWNAGTTPWVRAESLRLSDETLFWRDGARLRQVRLEEVQTFDVASFDPGLSLALVLSSLATAGLSLSFPSLLVQRDGDGEPYPNPEPERDPLPSPDRVFTERARRLDTVRVVVGQEVGLTTARIPDLAVQTRVGVRFRDFVEVAIGLRLFGPDILLMGPRSPLLMRELYLVPGLFGRLLLSGAFDVARRVALLFGGELGFDSATVGRVLWGVQVRLVSGLHLSLLPLTPVFSQRGVDWTISGDVAWHF